MQNHEYDPIGSSEARLQRLLRRREPLWRLIAASIYDVYVLAREARVTLIGFGILAFVNVIYLLFFYHDPTPDARRFTVLSALYETLRMMALETDLPLPDGDVIGEALFFITPLLGLALLFQGILNFGRFVLDKGSRREGWQISLARTYRNHVVVCGLGSVTYRVIRELLEAGYDVVAIERDWNSEFLEATLALSVPVIHGDARSREVLRNAGITRARSVIAGLNDDLANVEIGLAARRLRPGIQVILRIFNDELDLNLEQTFGHNSVFSASALAAPTLAAAALGRSIAHVLPLPSQFNHSDGAPRFLGVLQQRIPPGSNFVGPLEELEERFEVHVLHHVRGGASRRNGAQNHRPPERIEYGDEVALLGPLDHLERMRIVDQSVFNGQQPIIGLRSFSLTPLPETDRAFDTVIVCGLGRIGFRVVRALSLMRPRPRVVLIYQHPDTDRELLEEVRRLVADLYQGDARLGTVLQHAGIERACAVIAATGDDLTNMQIGLAARRLAPDIDLVLRVYNEDLAERLETLFGPHTTFSVPALAAPTLSAAAVVRGIDYAIEVAEQIYSTTALRVMPGDHLEGQTVGELRQKQKVLVLALRRGEEIIKVTRNTRLQAGDEVAALIDLRRLEQLHSRQAIRPVGRFRPIAPVKAQARR